MKKILICILPLIMSLSLYGCYQGESVNLLHFTDNLNRIRDTEEQIELSDYIIHKGSYKLIFNGEVPLLLTLEGDKNSKIKKVRLTVGKTDETGSTVPISDSSAAAFNKTACEVLEAFTFMSKEECKEIVSSLIPSDGANFSKTGEITTDKSYFHFVCYSNKLCLQFFAVNTFLEETEITSKPE